MPQSPPALDDGEAIRFDRKDVRVQHGGNRCGAGSGDSIVVCGKRSQADHTRYLKMEKLFREDPVKAETALGGGVTARVTGDSVVFPNGQISKRALVTIRAPF